MKFYLFFRWGRWVSVKDPASLISGKLPNLNSRWTNHSSKVCSIVRDSFREVLRYVRSSKNFWACRGWRNFRVSRVSCARVVSKFTVVQRSLNTCSIGIIDRKDARKVFPSENEIFWRQIFRFTRAVTSFSRSTGHDVKAWGPWTFSKF